MSSSIVRSAFIFFVLAGCSSASDVEVDCSKSPVRLSLVSKTDPTDCTMANGEILVSILGGVGEYELTINDQLTKGLNFKGLGADSYEIVATDKLGCSDSLTVNLSAPQSKNLTWSNQLKPIFESNCVKSGCHAGSGRGDFRKYADVLEYLMGIKRRVASGSMPPDNRLIDEQIRMIVCWIEAGANE